MNGNTGIEGLGELLRSAGLPELGPGPRAGVMPLGEVEAALNRALSGAKLTVERRELIRGLVLLWHDQMDAAHEIAQRIGSSDGSLLHGILHRREPDYGNAAYWFRRAGRHECFPEIARRVGELLKVRNEAGMERQLIRNGEWDPYGFIGLCEKAAGKGGDAAVVKILREVQGIEIEVLLESWMT
jgi:hypothetical protein